MRLLGWGELVGFSGGGGELAEPEPVSPIMLRCKLCGGERQWPGFAP